MLEDSKLEMQPRHPLTIAASAKLTRHGLCPAPIPKSAQPTSHQLDPAQKYEKGSLLDLGCLGPQLIPRMPAEIILTQVRSSPVQCGIAANAYLKFANHLKFKSSFNKLIHSQLVPLALGSTQDLKRFQLLEDNSHTM